MDDGPQAATDDERPAEVPDEAQGERRPGRQPERPSQPQDSHPASGLARMPALSFVACLAAFTGMAISRLIVPALNGRAPRSLLLRIDRWGDFATNLGAIAALVALSVALLAFVRMPACAGLRLRLSVAGLAGLFLPTMALATFFSREHTTAQMVLLGIAAANLLAIVVAANAVRFAPSMLTRSVAMAGAVTAFFALASQAAETFAPRALSAWYVGLAAALRGIGEAGYVVVLLGGAALAYPREPGARDALARTAGLFLFCVLASAFYVARATMGDDFALLLHHSQRVAGLIDTLPVAYGLPLCAAVAGAVAGLLARDGLRAQAAAGVLLMVSAGYAPRAPDRLLALTLAIALIARAIAASGAQNEEDGEQ